MNGFTLLAPWWLALGAAVAGALAVLHAITVGRPRPAWLPTARFAPDRAPRAERRIARPADRWLLALRVAAALFAAVALARLAREPARQRVARVVLADISDPGARSAVRDSVRALVGPGDALVAFAATPRSALYIPSRPPSTPADSTARRASLDSAVAVVSAAIPDGNAEAPASLSAALIAARRAAPALAAAADSIELVIVSPFPRDAVDAATPAVRGTWAGRARTVLIGARPAGAPAGATATRTPAVRPAVTLRGGPGDDALAAALALAGVAQTNAAPVRVVRTAPTTVDRAWSADRGHVLVVWPAGADGRGATAPAVGAEALVVGGRAAVGAFGRMAVRTELGQDVAMVEAHATAEHAPARVVARWADGAPAARERRSAAGGCVRSVGAYVPQAGAGALRPDFLALLPALIAPCGIARDSAPLAPAELARLAGAGSLLAATSLRAPASVRRPDPLGATLLALAAALLLIELPLRRLARRSTAESDATGLGDDTSRVGADTNLTAPHAPVAAPRAAA